MNSQDNRKAILEASSFVEYTLKKSVVRLKAYDTVLFCFDPGIYSKLKRRFKGQVLHGLTGELYLSRNGVALAGLMGIGCPAAVAFMEELVACGMRRFISLGTAGALHLDRPFADVMICSGALTDEGTSRHYLRHQFLSKPTRRLTTQIVRWLTKRNIPFTRGKTWTTDAPYRETKAKLNRFRAAGAQVVEMEACAMFNVACFRKVSLASVFIISDSIAYGRWHPGFNSAGVKEKSLLVAKELLKFLLGNPL
jgi:uridine phosphorylase